ncbi:hypothetical protein M3661_18535 [Paenibacillus sp. MER 180]|uniref:hypothetical protein n=1 Tax=Paenibacillus sp. MER 180 TaxID=2939570 RepID=UPI002040FD69|nr:hypothetical protein [Paenibacillus sp. MER 180]MCM3292121.1 hypothetical protein [Paenibacillus sp. MER 180]
MNSKELYVSNGVMDSFVSVNEMTIKDIIINNILQRGCILKNGDVQVCFIFNKDNCYVYEISQSNIVSGFYSYSYEIIIPNDFLQKFLTIKEQMSSRLKRWIHQDYYGLLREEIIEAMIDRKLKIEQGTNDFFILKWRKIGVEIIMSNQYILQELKLVCS